MTASEWSQHFARLNMNDEAREKITALIADLASCEKRAEEAETKYANLVRGL